MMTPKTILEYVKAAPFCPFRISTASGKTFDIRHPEMIKVGKTNLLVFSMVSDAPEVFDEWTSVSLMLTESITHLDAALT